MGKKDAGDQESETLNLKSEQKVLLLRSIAQYLDRCGFSKCLKKLLSEAEIEKKELGSSLPDLDEVFLEYLKKRDNEAGDLNTLKSEDIETLSKKGEEDASDIGKKGKKKKKKEAKSDATQEKSKDNSSEIKEETDVKIEEEPKNCDSSAFEASKDAHEDVEKEKKNKKKKQKESKLEASEKVGDGSSEDKNEPDVEMVEQKKDKKKKKKSKSDDSKSLDAEKAQEADEAEKISKKRKRTGTEDEQKDQTMNDKDDEESKRRKKDESVDVESVLETPAKQSGGSENENLEEIKTQSTNKKSGKKQLDGSKEPKKPFQRVNVEEVEFFDERLKDNSYWAKDGADSGYGAKAQEVLGQVRGKGFRHEKTKKKRGSYRGGMIDMDSHSVKFSYSDEE